MHAEVQFLDGSGGRIVIVDGAQNPKGAVVVAMGTKGSPVTTTPLAESLAQLRVQDTIDAYCLQARVFGQLNLPGVDLV